MYFLHNVTISDNTIVVSLLFSRYLFCTHIDDCTLVLHGNAHKSNVHNLHDRYFDCKR